MTRPDSHPFEEIDDHTGSGDDLRHRIIELEKNNELLRRQLHADQQKSATWESSTSQLKQVLAANRRQLDNIARVHASFLPHEYPSNGGLAFAGHCRPCADVGGDFYDVKELSDGRLAVAMADVSGHGAQAAVAMGSTRALLRAALFDCTITTGPADILLRLSLWFQDQLESEQFVTMWLALYDPRTRILRYASAAHPPSVIWRKDQDLEYLASDPCLPLGLCAAAPFRPEEKLVELGVGDRVFLYTDAWTESRSASGETLDGDKFLDLLSNSYGQPVRQVPAVLFMLFERHAANSRIRDDVSLLVFDRVE